MELHQLMEGGDIATTTFGPLNKYVAANDNFPKDTRQDFGRVIGDVVLRASDRPKPRAATFLDFCNLDGFIYVGSPYSKYADGHDKAAVVASQCAAVLMRAGFCVFAPIPHGHAITLAGELPKDWEFWKMQCDPMINAAAGLIVLTMDGWQESVGLTYEISSFLVARKPVLYLDPATIIGDERMTA